MQKKKGNFRKFLKWFVPKIAGALVLALGAINNDGKLPKTAEDYTLIAIGVGLGFASNGKNVKEAEDNE